MASARSRWLVAGIVAVVGLVLVSLTVVAAQWVTRPADDIAEGDGPGSASPQASPESSSASPCQVEQLVIGSLTPQTGSLAFLGPPADAAIATALAEVNDAGGVLGSPVRHLAGDSGDPGTGVAIQAAAQQVAQGAQAIIGPASSAVALEIIDDVTSSGVVIMSPSSTSPALAEYPDDGLFFRVVPSDALQGVALAETARTLGSSRAASMVRADAYGAGIQEAFDATFAAQGGTVVASVRYGVDARSFADAVTRIAATGPDAVLVAGFDETAAIIKEMVRQGIGPTDIQVLLAEGGVSTTQYEALPRGTMVGAVGALPLRGPLVGRKAFHQRLLDTNPQLTTFAYGAETYDAVILVALAAEYAGCADGPSIAAALPFVANGRPGTAVCGTYADCREIIGRGAEPNFEGVTGPLDLDEQGEPRAGSVEVVRFTSNTRYQRVEVIGPREVPAAPAPAN